MKATFAGDSQQTVSSRPGAQRALGRMSIPAIVKQAKPNLGEGGSTLPRPLLILCLNLDRFSLPPACDFKYMQSILAR